MFAATKIDPWFLKQIFLINETAMTVREAETLTPKLLKKAKLAGLSDVQVAHLRGLGDEGENTIRELRWTYGLRPVYKTVDTCAARDIEQKRLRVVVRVVRGRGNVQAVVLRKKPFKGLVTEVSRLLLVPRMAETEGEINEQVAVCHSPLC